MTTSRTTASFASAVQMMRTASCCSAAISSVPWVSLSTAVDIMEADLAVLLQRIQENDYGEQMPELSNAESVAHRLATV